MPDRNSTSFQFTSQPPYQPDDPSHFSLHIRQQPEQSRLSTGNERERRVIEPPPIIQISLNQVSSEQECNWLQNPYYFMCANLVHATDDSRIYTPHHPALAGQIVSAMYRLKDVNNQDGGFFVFGDLSVKAQGQFRLKFTLFKIKDAQAINIMSVMSSPFMTYIAKSYPGTLEPTFLSRSFYDQGARIRIRKENSLQVSQKRKAQYEATNDSHRGSYSRTSPVSVHCLRSSLLASPPASHFAGEAIDSSKKCMFPIALPGKQHADTICKPNNHSWCPTVSIPTSAPMSPFPSPPLPSLPEQSVSAQHRSDVPILPPLRNLPAFSSGTLPAVHALHPSPNSSNCSRHMV